MGGEMEYYITVRGLFWFKRLEKKIGVQLSIFWYKGIRQGKIPTVVYVLFVLPVPVT